MALGFGILKGIITGLFNNFEQHGCLQILIGCVLGNDECGMKGWLPLNKF